MMVTCLTHEDSIGGSGVGHRVVDCKQSLSFPNYFPNNSCEQSKWQAAKAQEMQASVS